MFDVGFSELVMVALIALLVIGPERLPKAARIAGLWLGKARSTIASVKAEIKQELHAEEMRQLIQQQSIADELRQILVAERLADGQVLAGMVPVVVDGAVKQRTEQRAGLPVVVNGRISRSGDKDIYRLDARAGDRIVAEVRARRLGSPLDSSLTLTDRKGSILRTNDDCEDRGAGLETHHADSYLDYQVLTNGEYFLQIADTQSKGGDDYAYRLRISQPRPDFALRVVPSSVNFPFAMRLP